MVPAFTKKPGLPQRAALLEESTGAGNIQEQDLVFLKRRKKNYDLLSYCNDEVLKGQKKKKADILLFCLTSHRELCRLEGCGNKRR